VTYHPRSDRDQLHVAYAVGRPVGTAVTRNRVRRRLRAAVAALDRVDLAPGCGDMLVAARPRAAEASFVELDEDLRRVFASLRDGAGR
jgi:ribonuclease P protein component